jgi:hypothetical protein
MWLQGEADRGGSNATRLASEQRLPDGALQSLDLVGDRGLRDAKCVCCRSERSGIERRHEALELGDRKRYKVTLWVIQGTQSTMQVRMGLASGDD